MDKNDECYCSYVNILKRELVPAMGCTEPIAVAYCAAKAREVLGEMPKNVEVLASGNIIKNVKSVIIPNSGGMRGISAAAALGILYGKAGKEFEVISDVSDDEKASLKDRMEEMEITVKPFTDGHVLDLKIIVRSENHEASIRICKEHTNIVEIIKDGVRRQYDTGGP